ncbi:MAG: putative sulfate exporter family transporter [Propionibacteriales bacterium]|nr:putative sulfate exporter family transporter [Propionibacteriales bacterium]
MTRTASLQSPRTQVSSLAPGLALVAAVTVPVVIGSRLAGPTISPLLVAILLGVLVRNLVPLPTVLDPGLEVAGKRLLRAGVVLLGLQLSLGAVAAMGPGVIILVVVVVGVGVLGTLWMGRRLGIRFEQRLLIACGFSICGASAVAAAEGVIDAEDEEVVAAVALVVVFGTVMIPIVPLLGGWLGLTPDQQGIFAGAAIHEVAQVVAAGTAVGGGALGVAILVKLARVLMLAPVLGVLAARQRRHLARQQSDSTLVRRPPIVPVFVLGFLAAAILRTIGAVPAPVLDVGQVLQTVLLTAAMFALGCGVRLARLRRVGWRPAALAVLSTALVSAVALGGAVLIG